MSGLWRMVRLERNTTIVASPGVSRSKRIAITFDFWRDVEEAQDPKAYGETYFARRGIGQVHVFAHWHHWFQVEEMERVLDSIVEVTKDADERIVYGSSMGGFASLAFAERVAADIVIAIAPRYSIDPGKGWERTPIRAEVAEIERYHQDLWADGPADAFPYERIDEVALPPRTYIVYDPGSPGDAQHVAAIAAHHDIIPVHCLNAGHWPDIALRDAGMLSTVISGAIAGTLEPPVVYELAAPVMDE